MDEPTGPQVDPTQLPPPTPGAPGLLPPMGQPSVGQPQGAPVTGTTPSAPPPSAPPQDGSGESGWGQSTLHAEEWGGTWVRPHDQPPGGGAPSDGAGVYGGGGGHHGGGSSQSKSRGPKPIRGPRFGGGPLIAGLGLLGLLVTIAIMALMAVKVLDGTNSAADKAGVKVAPGVPGGLVTNETLPGGSGGVGGGGTMTDAARASRCATNKSTIGTAVEAYSVMNGQSPASIQDLTTAGLIEKDDGLFKLESATDGSIAVVGVGECEGF